MFNEKNDHDLLISIATIVDNIEHRLFGNGQPGELDELKDRTVSLEEFKNRVMGALILLSVITGGSLATIIYHIMMVAK